MGSLILPSSGTAYVDANCVVYTVERIEPYEELLRPLWAAAASAHISIISSELVVLESLVRPLREKAVKLEAAFRELLLDSEEFLLLPIDLRTIERAANIRAHTGLKTPDAIHAATALEAGAALFVTNDSGFRRVPGLPVVVLSDLLSN